MQNFSSVIVSAPTHVRMTDCSLSFGIHTRGDGLLTHSRLIHGIAFLLVQCSWEGGMFTQVLYPRGHLGGGKSQPMPGKPAVKVARGVRAVRTLSLSFASLVLPRCFLISVQTSAHTSAAATRSLCLGLISEVEDNNGQW